MYINIPYMDPLGSKSARHGYSFFTSIFWMIWEARRQKGNSFEATPVVFFWCYAFLVSRFCMRCPEGSNMGPPKVLDIFGVHLSFRVHLRYLSFRVHLSFLECITSTLMVWGVSFSHKFSFKSLRICLVCWAAGVALLRQGWCNRWRWNIMNIMIMMIRQKLL